MTVIAETLPASRPARWTGRILSGLVIVFLMFDGAIKLVPWPVVTETMDRMGYGSSETLARSLGIITIVCTVLYSIPPTSILGAILLTGYLGGAMASHVRIGSPLFTHTLFGLYLGLMVWGGLWLRDRNLQTLDPVPPLTRPATFTSRSQTCLKSIAIIAVILAIAIAVVLILAATKPIRCACSARVSIKAPPEKIFPLINDFHQWSSWSPYENKDPAMKRTYSGAERGKGAVYAWDGDKNVGSGRMEILEASAPRRSSSSSTSSRRSRATTPPSSQCCRRAMPPMSPG